MPTPRVNPLPGRAGYPQEFRNRAVDMMADLGSARKAGKMIGVYYKSILRWKRAAEQINEPNGRWRCSCSPMRIQTGLDCPKCRRPAPPRM